MYNKLKEEYRAQFPSQFDATFARMDEINKEKREILQYFQGRHYYEANIENMSDDAFARIRDLDIEYSNLSADLNNYLSTLTNPIESPFS
jgi:archaellum component FlaC